MPKKGKTGFFHKFAVAMGLKKEEVCSLCLNDFANIVVNVGSPPQKKQYPTYFPAGQSAGCGIR